MTAHIKHFYNEIDHFGCINRYSTLYREVVKQAKGGEHFVEIGAWKGASTAFMAVEIANSKKNIRFDTVDTWLGANDSVEQKNDKDVLDGNLYQVFLENIKPIRSYVKPIQATSVDASKKYADKSLDFVFIDGGHTYDDLIADITAWQPKVKDTGILAGDDYSWGGVKRAVDELLGDQVFLFAEGTRKDPYRCWALDKNLSSNWKHTQWAYHNQKQPWELT